MFFVTFQSGSKEKPDGVRGPLDEPVINTPCGRQSTGWGWGCLAGANVLIQADSPSGERLKPFAQTMKELDPLQFCVHFLSFRELGIWRVKNRPLPIGT